MILKVEEIMDNGCKMGLQKDDYVVMQLERKNKIAKFIREEFIVLSLDDMADMFFQIAKAIDHPLHTMDLELTKSWGEQLGYKAERTGVQK